MNVATPADDVRWDLTPLFSALDAPDFQAAMTALERDLSSLTRHADDADVRRRAEPPAIDAAAVLAIDDLLRGWNRWLLDYERLNGYLEALVTTNSYDTQAQRELSKLELIDLRRKQLSVRFEGWIGSFGSRLDELLARSSAASEHAFFLRETARQSRYLMSEELEALAADMCVDAGSAFGKLQGNVTSQLKVSLEQAGQIVELPIAAVHNLAYDADADIRQRGYRAEVAGWHSIRTTVAACLNGVKGTALTLARRRGRESVLAAALDENRIDRATLEALWTAIDEALPMFRRYLRAKAARLGRDSLPWWDLFAPVGGDHRTFRWPEARDFIVDKFAVFSDDLAALARRAFDDRWIDALPREGKRGGAYCMPLAALEQSRILANFQGTFEWVSTLAHELGHAYHNECQRGLTALQRGTPSTLAETASIFCETHVAEATIGETRGDERLAILEAQLCNATQVCVDIRSRFLFEAAVFERRAGSELSAEELCAIMIDAQRQTYGDAVDPTTYHPYMWLWKPHYYSYQSHFYNFPYAFGHLFGLGLYAEYLAAPNAFVPRYRDLLRDTGREYAVPLAARFGIDITRPAFWRQSLAIVAELVERFEAAAATRGS